MHSSVSEVIIIRRWIGHMLRTEPSTKHCVTSLTWWSDGKRKVGRPKTIWRLRRIGEHWCGKAEKQQVQWCTTEWNGWGIWDLCASRHGFEEDGQRTVQWQPGTLNGEMRVLSPAKQALYALYSLLLWFSSQIISILRLTNLNVLLTSNKREHKNNA